MALMVERPSHVFDSVRTCFDLFGIVIRLRGRRSRDLSSSLGRCKAYSSSPHIGCETHSAGIGGLVSIVLASEPDTDHSSPMQCPILTKLGAIRVYPVLPRVFTAFCSISTKKG